MSIPFPLAEIIIREAKRQPFTGGTALLFGRSGVGAELSVLENLLERLGVEKCANVDVEFDTYTQLAKEYPKKKIRLRLHFFKLVRDKNHPYSRS